MHLPLRLSFCAARVFWCDWKQILERCSYKKLWKPTASTLSLRHGRTTKPKRTAKPWRETWGSPCHLYQLRSTWQWAALEVEAQQAACFLQYCCMSNVTEYVSGSPGTTELRKTSNSTANTFVTVTYSDDMESEVLRSFFPSRARRCHFCMGISQKSRDCDRIMD